MNLVNYLNATHLTILSLLFIRFQEVRELHMFEYPSSDHTIPSSSSVPRMYVNLINCSSTTHLTIVSLLFIGLQIVSELGWLSEDLSSDHPITSPLSVSREYANLVNCSKISRLIIPFSSATFVFRMYVNLVTCYNTSQLIILSHLHHPYSGCSWTCQLFEYHLSDHPIPPLRPSSGSTRTWSHAWI